MTEVLELKKRFARLYKPSAATPVILDVPSLRFLMIDGAGDVGEARFQSAMGALFALAYPVKFAAKKRLDLSYPVMPAEGLYWDADEGPGSQPAGPRTAAWRLMILLPDAVSGEFVDEVRERVMAKKGLPELARIRVQTFTEGCSVQMMHIGPYADETPTVRRLFSFAAENGYGVSGSHHEIYLSDPNRSAPEKLKTVLRYAIRPMS